VRVRVKLGSSGVASPWMTRHRFLCARCASRDKDGLPATIPLDHRLRPPRLVAALDEASTRRRINLAADFSTTLKKIPPKFPNFGKTFPYLPGKVAA
jgi:hypothetical protein